MQIYIHRDNEDFGPYSREAVLEYVKQGVFELVDSACYAGMSEWKTVGELVGIGGKTKRGAAPRRPSHITEFNPEGMPEPPPPPMPQMRMSRKPGSKRGYMIALNLTLIFIAVVFGLMRIGMGRRLIRHGLLAMSAELAHIANTPSLNPAAAAPSPVAGPAVTKASSPAPAPVPVVAHSAAPVAAASPVPAVVAAATPPVATPVAAASPAAAAISPAAASSPQPASSPAMVASSDDTDASEPPAAPASTPAPAVSAAVSAPAQVAPAATPAPEAAATPAPPPKPFDPADLALNPAAWPKKLIINQAIEFPALYNGQVVGSVTAPAGSVVTLDNIQGTQLTVDYQGGAQKIPWTDTDLAREAAKLAAMTQSAATTTSGPPTTATPPTTSAPPSNPGLTAPTDTAPADNN